MKSVALIIIITLNNHRIITLFAARLLMARLRHTLSACPHLYHFPITNIKHDFYKNLKENKTNTPVSATAAILKLIRYNLHNPGSQSQEHRVSKFFCWSGLFHSTDLVNRISKGTFPSLKDESTRGLFC